MKLCENNHLMRYLFLQSFMRIGQKMWILYKWSNFDVCRFFLFRPYLSIHFITCYVWKLLDSFCRYQEALNDPDENSAGHWDLAIYMTGLDLWSKEGAFDTLGLAHTGGMCKPAYSCLVTEFGTRKNHALHLNNDFNTDGKPPQNTNAVKI